MLNHKTEEALLSNKTLKQKHGTCPQTIKQQWREPRILPSELCELIIPRTRSSAHTKNKNIRERWHYTKTWDDLPFLLYTTLLLIWVGSWQAHFDHRRTRKRPHPTWRRSCWWKLDIHSRMRRKVVFSPCSYFSFDFKTVPGKISITSDTQMTPHGWQKVKRN